MTEGMGLDVDVVDEDTIHNLAILRDPAELRGKYDLIWLASFDSLWKLLDAREAEGLKQAINQGLGFIHSGGPGSFHGGSFRLLCLGSPPWPKCCRSSFRNRDDLFMGESILGVGGAQNHPAAEVQLASDAGPEWDAAEWKGNKLDRFNRVQPSRMVSSS